MGGMATSNKSYVTLEQKVCIVCGKPYDTGNLLLDKRLGKTFDKYTVSGLGMCPDDAKKRDEGYIALIGCTNPPTASDTMRPEEAKRSGEIAHIGNGAFSQIFNVPAPEKGVAFVEQAVIEHLKRLVE